MTVSRSDLEQRFRMLADEVLMQRYQSGDLTDLAQSVALQELRCRGISPPVKGLVVEQAMPVISAQGADRVTVPVELSWAQAHALTARLNSQAIAATLVTDQLPVGGQIRVMVYERDLPEAMALAAALHRGDFALDDEFDGGDESPQR